MRFFEIKEQPDIMEIIGLFTDFCVSELDLEKPPVVVVTTNGDLGTSFGAYDPNDDIVYVEVANRHPMDILRTLAHEFVHYRQDMDDVLTADSGKDGSEHENEANATAAVIMRKFGKRKPELFRAGPVLP